ncbi:MAG: DUF192 domain-containing protein [Bryobacterales bacterium]|nr:DUF192 domain-containing protein [Bryobacteraceae bacterium]MDW8131684.1 DUF192 domain-containing protein [Bryobacterales bacterium]
MTEGPQQARSSCVIRSWLKLRIRNVTRDAVLAREAEVADTSRKRRIGLLNRECLYPGEALWITPCEAIHTIGMKFPIDVLFLSRTKKVLKLKERMPPGRIAVCLWAHSVLELPAGTLAATGTAVGDQLEFEKAV